MNKIILLGVLISVFVSCQARMLNQYMKFADKPQKRHGKWKEEYSGQDGKLIATGKYDKGEKIGVWKTTFQDKLYQKDKISKWVTKTKVYFPNGRTMEEGQSRLEVSDDQRHWYYLGDWKYYDEKGKLKYIKRYAEGKKVDSISFQ